ncbi:ATP-binding protein [Deltaproteobacteria bacterium TL4]
MSNLYSEAKSSHILIADDEPNVRSTLIKILSKKTSHQIDEAVDGKEAFEKWQIARALNPYDVIVLALKMLRMDGEELIKEIRKEDQNTDLILLTGHEDLSEAYNLLKQYQISDFLNKPLQSPLQFLFSVENALEKRRLRQELHQYAENLKHLNENLELEVFARRQVDDALQENRRALLNLMSNLPGMVYRRQNDEEWTMDYISDGGKALTGYSAEEMLGMSHCSFVSMVHPEDKALLAEKILKAVQTKESFEIIYRILAKDKEKWVLDKGNGYFDSKGKLKFIEGFITDITERKNAEEQLEKFTYELEKLNADKDKFFSIVSHDLRTPLTGLIGFSELLESKAHTYSPQKIQRSAYNINQAAKRLHSLLENMLEWSRIHTGRIKCEPSSLSLKKIVEENVLLFEVNAQSKNIRLLSQVKQPLFAYADENMIHGVLRNLISNAIKFTEKGGQIIVTSESNDNEVIVAVSDNGKGMSQEQVDQLFRIDVPHTTRGTADESGTGLGLLLCKELLEKNNGTLWTESEQGKGSTFKFRLPSAPQP